MDRPAVVTLYFVNTDHPAHVLAAEPRADRGFGRKYLAQLNPRWPITPIGQFSLNRSVEASENEFYIAGFLGLSLVHTYLPDVRRISEIDETLRHSLPAKDLYVTAVSADRGYGAFAHWQGDSLVRAFAARRERVYEDEGIPAAFELPYWAGEKAPGGGSGIDLPFAPIDLVTEATRAWVGISPDGPDVNVVGYATDGRPEPTVAHVPPTLSTSISGLVAAASSKLGLNPVDRDYDDYAEDSTTDNSANSSAAELGNAVRAGWRVLTRASRTAKHAATEAAATVSDRLRHTDKPR